MELNVEVSEAPSHGHRSSVSSKSCDIERKCCSSSIGDEPSIVKDLCSRALAADLYRYWPKSEILVDIDESPNARIESSYGCSSDGPDGMRYVVDWHTLRTPSSGPVSVES